MNTRTIVGTVTAIALTMFLALAAFAECPSGKTEVAIVTSAGGVIVTSNHGVAVLNIGGQGEVVIPAACPCFTPEEVSAAIEAGFNGSSEIGLDDNGNICGYAYIASCDGERYFFASATSSGYKEYNDDPELTLYRREFVGFDISPVKIGNLSFSNSEHIEEISYSEALAGVELLRSALK